MCPVYEYTCQCSFKDEKLEPLSAPEIQDCPNCNQKGTLKRVISRSTFVLSGGGWEKQGYN